MSGSVFILLLVFSQILSPLISISVNEELARFYGVALEKIRFLFMILLAMLISLALKVLGILLITALLIIPAATARLFSKSPKQMVLLSVFIAIVAVFLGLYSSLSWDFPTGPAIVVSASFLFLPGK